jgi:hypothetical protein
MVRQTDAISPHLTLRYSITSRGMGLNDGNRACNLRTQFRLVLLNLMRIKYFGAMVAVSMLLAGCGKETKAPSPSVEPSKVPQPIGQGQYQVGGVGTQLEQKAINGPAQIKAVVPGSPADKAGLKAGLLVLAIDDTPTAGKSLADCVNLVRGATGTDVRFTVVDPDAGTTNQVTLTREILTFR